MADNYESIINEAAEKLESRYTEIQDEIKPLRDEEREVAEAIRRIVGSYPQGYSGSSASVQRPSSRTRERMAPEEREHQVLAVVADHPDGINARQVADEIGVSHATATKAVKALIEAGQIKTKGERRNRVLLVP